MNAAALIPELENVLAHGSDEKRAGALRAITALFLERADRLRDEQVRLFDGIFIRLIARVDREARAELARLLAPLANAPAETMRMLTEDGEGPLSPPQESPQDPDAAVTALSQATAVPVEVVERIWTGARMESVLILCKAAGYSWPATRDLILAWPAMRDKAADILDHFRVSLNRENDPGSCIDAFSSREPVSTSLENAIDTARANFHALSESTARCVMRFWQMAPGNLRAA